MNKSLVDTVSLDSVLLEQEDDDDVIKHCMVKKTDETI